MQGAARTVPERDHCIGGAAPATEIAGPHMPPVPPRSHQQSWMRAFVREEQARHLAMPVLAGVWGIGARFTPAHGLPHKIVA